MRQHPRRHATSTRRARRGAALLDRVFRGRAWARRIDVHSLNIDSACNCVRGQLSESDWYRERYDAAMIREFGDVYEERVGTAHSDFASGVPEIEQRLAWIREIEARR